jgi:hypothetical protein
MHVALTTLPCASALASDVDGPLSNKQAQAGIFITLIVDHTGAGSNSIGLRVGRCFIACALLLLAIY